MKKLVLLTLLAPPLAATVLIPGNQQESGNATSFNQPVICKAYARATGTFFVGLNSNAGNYALSAGPRSIFGPTPAFEPIAKDITLNTGDGIELLTIANSLGNPDVQVGWVAKLTANPNTRALGITNADGSIVQTSPFILDASGAINQNGLPTSNIVGLAGNQNFLFAAVEPCGGLFGADCNGGIASVAINQSTLALTQVPAQPGDGGVKAALFDPTIEPVLINNSPTIVPNKVDMYWDDQLQRLYVGIQLTTAGTSTAGATCTVGTGTCNTAPLICPTGYQPDYALGTCVLCPSGGYYDPQLDECVACPIGQLFNPVSFTCVTATCPIGFFFNPDPLSLTCVTCPYGLYFDQNNLTCVTCPNGGFYSVTAGNCLSCPSGPFDPVSGVCLNTGPCPSGTYFNPEVDTCIPIPPCDTGTHWDPINFTCVVDDGVDEEFIEDTLPFDQALEEPGVIPIMPVLQGPLGAPDKYQKKHSPAVVGPQGAITRSVPTASGGRSVAVGAVSPDGAITFEPIAPDSAFMTGDPHERMVGVLDVVPRSLAINKVRVLHASTGPSYLVMSGGDGTIAQSGNKLFALPLVDDPSNQAAHGTLADPASALVNYKFVVPATTNAQLPSSTQPAVQIGESPLALNAGQTISDIDVVGDTVYVSINSAISAQSESGILYSQALFDQDGKIIRWTPWTKKAFPATTSPNGITFFAVDALTSKLWAVDSAGTSVYQTAWEKPISTLYLPNTSLTAQLNSILSTTAATAVLDLDQSTRGFLANRSRYALFAGGSMVIFTRVSQSTGSAYNSPQIVTTDYSLPTNLRITSLPPGACEITALEYARQLSGTPTNYFFAGTQNGLYVFADSGNGFDVTTMGALTNPPFSNGSWQQVFTIRGSIIDIKTTGNVLYVIAQDPISQTSTLYKIPFTPTVASMFLPGNITVLAQSGVGAFANAFLFSAIQIISTTPTGSTEQLVLATNNGLFASFRPGGVQAATSQVDAAWGQLPNTKYFYNGIGAPDNAAIPISSPSTVWPFHLADQAGLRTFDRSSLQQLAGTTDTGPFSFVPPFFNSIENNNPAFATLPQISYFWSDGARRIAIASNIQSSCMNEQLLSLPFNTIEWNIAVPEEGLIVDPALSSTVDFYWIKQIGVTGLLLTGTQQGIIGLQ